MVTRTAIEDNTEHNPGSSSYATSGDNSGSGLTQDWYNHTQILDAQYIRINQQDYSASTPFSSPSVVKNVLQVNYTVQTNDEVILSSNFLGDQVALQTLELISANNTSGAFGTQGTISTSSVGLIRRAARKDSNGVILDPTGICVRNGTVYLDETPGVYNGTYDTSTSVNGVLGMLIGRLPNACGTFSPTLVDL